MAITVEQLQALITPNIRKGWQADLDSEDYHKDKTAVNFSSLKHIEKSEFAFARSFWGKPKEATKSMEFGTLAHMACLEGAKFKERYVVMPEFTGVTAKGELTTSRNATDVKRKIADWTAAQAPNAIIIDEIEREKLFNMMDSLLSNDKAVKLLSNGIPEAIGYWTDEETGINLRMAADFISFNLGVLADVKTCPDSRWEQFRRSVESYRYDIQMAMYNEGVHRITKNEPQSRAWIAIESVEPHEVRIHEVGAYYEEIGKFEFRRSLTKLKEAIDKKAFPQGGKEIMIGEPTYHFKRKYIELGVLEDQI